MLLQRSLTWFLFLAFLECGATLADEKDEIALRRAVVKISVTRNVTDYSKPWQRGNTVSVSGAGLWLGKGRVLTNAHVVTFANTLAIQQNDSSDELPGKVTFLATDIDLAIVQLDDATALSGLAPPEFSPDLPRTRATVQTYGYPEGGTSLSVTEGIVSRIEYVAHSAWTHGLRIQIDAAVNPGNSGGPVVQSGRVIGITSARRQAAENMGYAIPSDEIKMFLEDAADGTYDGKPGLYDEIQSLQNAALRKKLGLDRETTGVWVRRPFSGEAENSLRTDDVITRIGDYDIDNTGMVRMSDELRVRFGYLVPKLCVDGRVPFTVQRGGERHVVNVPTPRRLPLLLESLNGKYPSYFIYGPLVLCEATSEFIDGIELGQYSSDDRQRAYSFAMMRLLSVRQSPLLTRRYERPASDGERLVIIAAGLLPHRLSTGYGNPQTHTISRVNGQPIQNLSQLVRRLRNLKDPFVTLEFVDAYSETLVFDREEMLAVTNEILATNGIPRCCSEDLLAVWGDGKPE